MRYRRFVTFAFIPVVAFGCQLIAGIESPERAAIDADAGDAVPDVENDAQMDAPFDPCAPTAAATCPSAALDSGLKGYCENFEPSDPLRLWEVRQNRDAGVAVDIVAPPACPGSNRGAQVVRFRVGDDPNDGGTREGAWIRKSYYLDGIGTDGTFGLRAFVYVDALPSDDSAPMPIYLEGDPAGHVELYTSRTGSTVRVVTEMGDTVQNSPFTFVPKRWYCVDIELTLKVAGRVQVSARELGGSPVTLIDRTNLNMKSRYNFGIQFIQMGLRDTNRVGTSTMYIDDVAFGEGRMGCD